MSGPNLNAPKKAFTLMCCNPGSAHQVDQESKTQIRNMKERNLSERKAVKAMLMKKYYIKQRNRLVRREAFRCIRRPGRNHAALLLVLDQLLGSLQVKKEVIRDVIEESLRFKRRMLARILEEYAVKLEMQEHPERLAKCPKCNYVHAAPCKRNIG